MSADERLAKIRLKIERAKYHISDLENRIRAFRETEPYRLLCDQNPQTKERVFRIQVLSKPPSYLPLVAGDAIHNLRSALDHLAWQLVEAGGGTPGRQTSFPIFQIPAEYERLATRKIEGMRPGSICLIEAVQPYKTGNPLLWELNELDNFDKHRLLLVVAYGVRQFGFSYRNPILLNDPNIRAAVESFMRDTPDIGELVPLQRSFIFEDGAEVARIAWREGPLQMNENLDLTYDVAVAQPKIIEGKPILPLLHQLAQIVDSIVSQFVPYL